MRRASLMATGLVTLLGMVLPVRLSAAAKPEQPPAPSASGEKAQDEPSMNSSPDHNSSPDQADKPGEERAPKPQNAAAALFRAGAAYEYGDMNQVVEAARPVAEGLIPATPSEQAQAFRLLGIGLYLTNRPTGAETAFSELLRRDAKARLDPTTTRPEVVAFFNNLRRQQLTRQRRVIWCFIPPFGQFQNEDNAKGWGILGVGVVSLATAGTSLYLLKHWQHAGYTYSVSTSTAKTVEAVNWIATGVLAATYLYGVFDALVGYNRPLEGDKLSFKIFPEGGVGFAF